MLAVGYVTQSTGDLLLRRLGILNVGRRVPAQQRFRLWGKGRKKVRETQDQSNAEDKEGGGEEQTRSYLNLLNRFCKLMMLFTSSFLEGTCACSKLLASFCLSFTVLQKVLRLVSRYVIALFCMEGSLLLPPPASTWSNGSFQQVSKVGSHICALMRSIPCNQKNRSFAFAINLIAHKQDLDFHRTAQLHCSMPVNDSRQQHLQFDLDEIAALKAL